MIHNFLTLKYIGTVKKHVQDIIDDTILLCQVYCFMKDSLQCHIFLHINCVCIRSSNMT